MGQQPEQEQRHVPLDAAGIEMHLHGALPVIDIEQQRRLVGPPAIDGRLAGPRLARHRLDGKARQILLDDRLGGIENGLLGQRIAAGADGAARFGGGESMVMANVMTRRNDEEKTGTATGRFGD